MSDEPVVAPSELWLRSPVGPSFPDVVLGPGACSAEKELVKEAGNEQGQVPLRTLWQNGQVEGSARK